MTWMPIVAMLLVYLAYNGLVTAKYGILKSVSDSYYWFPRNQNPLFTFFMWGLGSAMLWLFIVAPTNMWYLGSAVCLFLTGAAPDFKSSTMTDRVHGTGAVGAIACALAGLTLIDNIYYPAGLFGPTALLMMYYKVNNKTLWVEHAAFFLVLIGLIDKYIIK